MKKETNVLVIAEIGINHNGSITLAKKMIESAKASGADIVKFQTFSANLLTTDKTPLADYMGATDVNFLQLAKRLELTFEDTIELKDYASELNIEFLSSPFDELACEFLGSIGLKRLKIPSGEAVNPFLLKKAAETQLPLIVSTGMATMDEVLWCLDFLKLNKSGPITLLHCTTQYPTEAQFCNLSVIQTLADKFKIPIGYSDHTLGIDIPLAAVALGAVVIEKHFTLDKGMEGPDHAASLEPKEFLMMVQGIRRVELSMGNGIKRPFPVEIEIAKIARKSLVARHFLPKGHVLTLSDLTAKRPGTGIPAILAEQLVNQKLLKNINQDELISWKIMEPF